MFKGVKKEFQDWLGRFNQKSDKFIFSFSDLELVEINGKRRKCRILSNELIEKLREIYSEGNNGYNPPIKFIDFELDSKEDSKFFEIGFYADNYHYWLSLEKKLLQEDAKISSDGVLWVNFVIKTTTDPALHISDFSLFFYQEKANETKYVRPYALGQINLIIKKGNIDLTTLADSGLFLNESYMSARPHDCLACWDIDPNTTPIAKYYETHINKCLWRPDRINEFEKKQVELIARIINQFDNYKNSVIQKIIHQANSQSITETELNNNRPNWQNHLRSLKNRKDITDYQTKQLEKDIENLVSAKKKNEEERQQAEAEARENAKKEEERLKKEQEEKEKKEAEEKEKKEREEEQENKRRAEEEARQQELNQKRDSFIAEITTALNQEPKLTNNELSPQYQNWEEQISVMTDIQQITNLQDRLLADIQARRKDKKTAEEIKENLKKAKTGTQEEKQQAWENLEKEEKEKSYNDNKEETDELKKGKAAEDPQKYSEEVKKKTEEKLKDGGIEENELESETQKELQKLKDGEIKDADQLVAAENKIKQDIYQKEAAKKITDLTSQVNEVLKAKNKSQIIELKKKLLEFISSSNIYYSIHQKTAENLLAQLENYLAENNNQNNSLNEPKISPWKIVIPLLLIGPLLIVFLVLAKRISKRKKQR